MKVPTETRHVPPAGRSAVFISYRREDAAGHAGRLYDSLASRFRDDHVFMDVDTIRGGDVFSEAIDNALNASDVVVVLIGMPSVLH